MMTITMYQRVMRSPALRTRITAILAIAGAGIFASACDVHGVSNPGTLSTLTVSPNPRTLAINGTQQFTAVGTDFAGAVITLAPTWTVVAGGGAISSSGLFTAGGVTGTFASTVQATSGGMSSTATVIVTVGPLASIVVTPTPVSLAVGTTQQFTATGRDAGGNVVNINPVWSVDAGGGVVNVNSGLFLAGAVPGTYANTVRASVNGISGLATVSVTPGPLASISVIPGPDTTAVNGTKQFIAIGRDASGNTVDIAPVWTIVNGGGAIGGTSGVFTAGAVTGTFANTVRAASGTIFGSATETVIGGALASITVTPNPASLIVGSAQQFTAVGRDALGNMVPMTPVWSVVNGGGAIVSSSGLFTASNAPGTYTNTVRASSGGIAGAATVILSTGPLSVIIVTPNPDTTAANGTQQFTAVGRDAFGNNVAITPTWSIVNGGGTIGVSSGLFTAGGVAGTFIGTIRATSGGTFGSATEVVLPLPPAPPTLVTITVTPNPTTMLVNGTQQFTATGRDGSGNVLAITPVWGVVNGGGTINATSGNFTAGAVPGTFSNTVRATVGGVFGSATVTVNAGALASITVTPNPDTTAAFGTQQFIAVGRDGSGNVVALTPVWSVVNGGGTINAASGMFNAGGLAGTYVNTIRATSGNIVGSATETVLAVPPAPPSLTTITVTPNPASMLMNATQQFTATGRDGNGNVVAITPVWTVVNGGGRINANSGLFTAGATPGTYTNTVRATSGSIFGSATVTVNANPVVPPFINLGSAAANGIMAGTAVTCVTGGIINANVSISPGNTISGFGPCVITGVQHLADAVAAQAQIDLTTAYNTLAGLPCPPANFIAANLGGTTKTAGVYCSASSIGVTGALTLDGGGDPNAVFVFQAGTSLITAGDIVLINGAQAKNVYWQVGSSATIGTASHWQGNILALTSITLVDNATLFGRALARNGGVTLGTNNVITLP
jgi:hypothetical protein